MHDKHGLLTQPIAPLLQKLTTPTVFGIIAVLLFSIVDTFFISLLGTNALAAISFTFPVTFAVNCITMGIGIGLSVSIGRLLGGGNTKHAARLATHGTILAVGLIAIIGGVGALTIHPLFSLLGAEEQLISLIDDYMSIWFLFIPLLTIPMVSNSAIRATGDTLTPAKIMLFSGAINGLLDPLFIFGFGPFPELGIKGAAIASAISWLAALVTSFYILIYKIKLFALPQTQLMLNDWKQILRIGTPAGLSNAISPIAGAILMVILSSHGTAAVASYGAAQRVEALMLLVMMALSSALTPFISQNLGAQKPDRVKEGLSISIKFSLLFQFILYLLFVPLSIPISHLFSDDNAVQYGLWLYLLCVPISYGFQGVNMILISSLNAMQKPLHSFIWSVMRFSIFTLPSAWIGSYYYNMEGLFVGIAIGNILSGMIALFYMKNRQQTLIKQITSAS